MRFSSRDIQQFADWSGDQNPLHVDPAAARRTVFGQTVVHGMLSAIYALNAPPLSREGGVRRLDIEFRSAVFPETSCTLVPTSDADGSGVAIVAGDAPLVTIHVNKERASERIPDLSWVVAGISDVRRRPQPAVLDAHDLRLGREITARYETGGLPDGYTAPNGLLPVQARVLGLCSYLVGMELPGLRSLLGGLRLASTGGVPGGSLRHRVRVEQADPRTGRLVLDGILVGGGGAVRASIEAFGRPRPAAIEPIAAFPGVSAPAAGTVVVVGASRGFGAALVLALLAVGYRVHRLCAV